MFVSLQDSGVARGSGDISREYLAGFLTREGGMRLVFPASLGKAGASSCQRGQLGVRKTVVLT